MAIQNKSTVCAIVPEVTEGTPVAPTSATEDYIALQEGFTVAPSFDELENAELTGSIGMSKSALGFENPTASLSHYLKHSGVEGTEPAFGLLIESCLGGTGGPGAEYDTVAGSTTSVVNVDSGEGSNYERGTALLVKDATNGYSVRNVLSVSTDALTLAFDLANAPASGVNLGNAILKKPANSGHPTFAKWVYRGNGGATELIAGCRATSMTINCTAGEFVNTDFDIEGIEYFWNPIEIAAADIYLDFTSDNGTFAAVVAAGWYKNPHDLADAIAAALVAQDSAETYTCTYSNSTGKFTIATSTSAVLTLLWNTGANAANTIADKIGFSTAADDSGAQTYTSDNAQTLSSPQTADYDDLAPVVSKNIQLFIGDSTENTCVGVSEFSLTVTGEKSDLLSICATSGKSGSLVTSREVTGTATLRVSQYDAKYFDKFSNNENVQLAFTAGNKTGGNWVAGECVNVFIPTATVNSFELQDTDNIVEYSLSFKGYVADGLGEVYINFL
jgi:hypothetical protein